eukprot:CAMPEP_0196590052 /NCGR_PEP_ID=MMETSP1081-20130531/65372_1 /TAXON_ID=36882 /ORGANISM="Pyramimonas amylifera, Strain CCMP720" /LENGTH=445 /DNA_ID=CAMNT_0041913029 /DNA_START=258 /DNA_END=1595 /DNA_ORIENTATION=+
MVTRRQWHDLFVNKIKITGSLKKRNSQNLKLLQRWNKRWFFLTDEVLAYAKSRKDSVMRGTIQVGDICEARGSNTSEHEGIFEVVVPKRVLVLRCKSGSQKRTWVDAINTAVAALKDHRHSDSSAGASPRKVKQQPRGSLSEKSSASRRGQARALSIKVPDPEPIVRGRVEEKEGEGTCVLAPAMSRKSLRERYASSRNGIESGSGSDLDEGDGEEGKSDGYESGHSWKDSELNDMSPIPTPTDPRLWHPRFQSDEEDEDGEERDWGLHSSGTGEETPAPMTVIMDSTGELPVGPTSSHWEQSDMPSFSKTKTPDTPMNCLDLQNVPKANLFAIDQSADADSGKSAESSGIGRHPPSSSSSAATQAALAAQQSPDAGDARPRLPAFEKKRSIKDTIKNNLRRKNIGKNRSQKKCKLSPRALEPNNSNGTVKLYGNALFAESSKQR